MFWRILGRELKASRTRLGLALLVVASGAAVVSAAANLEFNIDGKLARTFRVFGANVVVTPSGPETRDPQAPRRKESGQATKVRRLGHPEDSLGFRGSMAPGDRPESEAVMPAAAWQAIAARHDPRIAGAAPYLYVAAHLDRVQTEVIVAGTDFARARPMNSWWKITGRWPAGGRGRDRAAEALVGSDVARILGLGPGGRFRVTCGGKTDTLVASGVLTAGGPEDNQIFVDLGTAQQLAGLPNEISLVQLSVAGFSGNIRAEMRALGTALPSVRVEPIPEFTQAEAALAAKIQLLLEATVGLILALTALGVLASMAALASDRRHDVGVMKAIGGATRRIVRLFLAEVGMLAAAGSLAGCALGFPLSNWISERAFGSGTAVQWEVVPLVAALMFGAALGGALPLRLLGRVRPAVILRGEGWNSQ